MIRSYIESDLKAIRDLHSRSGLPDNCLPDLHNPLFRVKLCALQDGKIVQFAGVRLTGEAFCLVDHDALTPEERWQTMQRLIAAGLFRSSEIGLEDVSAWLPPHIEKQFGPRLESMGWIKSPWPTYSALLK